MKKDHLPVLVDQGIRVTCGTELAIAIGRGIALAHDLDDASRLGPVHTRPHRDAVVSQGRREGQASASLHRNIQQEEFARVVRRSILALHEDFDVIGERERRDARHDACRRKRDCRCGASSENLGLFGHRSPSQANVHRAGFCIAHACLLT